MDITIKESTSNLNYSELEIINLTLEGDVELKKGMFKGSCDKLESIRFITTRDHLNEMIESMMKDEIFSRHKIGGGYVKIDENIRMGLQGVMRYATDNVDVTLKLRKGKLMDVKWDPCDW